MLRSNPTVISLTAGEVKDVERRCRFRRHLMATESQQGPTEFPAKTDIPRLSVGLSSPTLSALAKDEEDLHNTPGQLRRALASSPPQSRVVSAEDSMTAQVSDRQASEESRERHDLSVSEMQSPVMSPHRFPHQARLVRTTRGYSGEGLAEPVRSTSRAGILDASDESIMEVSSDMPTSPRRPLARPRLPPPFSRTSRGRNRNNRTVEDSDMSDGEDDVGEPTVIHNIPVRRSSLGARAGVPAVEEQTQVQQSSPVQPGDARGRSSRRHHPYQKLGPTPGSPSTSARTTDVEASSSSPSTILGRLQIYNDSLPRFSQPETPQRLPEARHQSHLLGAYTAPAGRRPPLNFMTLATSRRQRDQGRRSPSPPGMQSPGFLGLYGGIENTDDRALFEQAERGPRVRVPRNLQTTSFDS